MYTVTDSMQNRLGYRIKNQKPKWMTDEILWLMDELRKDKNKTDMMYKNSQDQHDYFNLIYYNSQYKQPDSPRQQRERQCLGKVY